MHAGRKFRNLCLSVKVDNWNFYHLSRLWKHHCAKRIWVDHCLHREARLRNTEFDSPTQTQSGRKQLVLPVALRIQILTNISVQIPVRRFTSFNLLDELCPVGYGMIFGSQILSPKKLERRWGASCLQSWGCGLICGGWVIPKLDIAIGPMTAEMKRRHALGRSGTQLFAGHKICWGFVENFGNGEVLEVQKYD